MPVRLAQTWCGPAGMEAQAPSAPASASASIGIRTVLCIKLPPLPAPQRPEELAEISLRRAHARHPVAFGPFAIRQVMRAEPAVDHGQVDGEVAVHCLLLDG